MERQISHCPLCGVAFERVADRTDSRYPSAYKCEHCEESLEMRVNRFPRA